jgi:REP element-mobilizing transposase RayT
MNKYNPHTHHRRSIRLKGYDYSQAGLYFITICCQDRIYRFGDVKNGEMVLNEFGEIAHNEWIKLTDRFDNFELDVFQIMPNHMHGIILLNDVGATLAVAQNELDARNSFDDSNELDARNSFDDSNELNNQNELDESNCITDQNDVNHVGAGFTPDQNDFNDTRAGASPAKNDFNDTRAGASPAPTVFDIVGAYKSLVANGCLNIYKSKNEIMGKFWQRNYWEHIIRNDESYQHISNYIINNTKNWHDDKFYK